MGMDDGLKLALKIAFSAHEGREDRQGEPYILHPLRVAFSVSTDEERIIAVLHDVVEDSDWTIENLKEWGFSESVVEAVDALTRRKDETYDDFIIRIMQNPLAKRVKLADLADNTDETRGPIDAEQTAKYQRAIATLSL